MTTETNSKGKTMQNSGYFKLEQRENNTVLYPGRDGCRTLLLRKDVTREQVRITLGDLPSGSHNRWNIAKQRVRVAGLVSQGKTMTTTTDKITRVMFTYTMMCNGMWVERSGAQSYETLDQLESELGKTELSRLRDIAYANGMCGMWYNADNGRNVFVNGVEVN